MSNKFRPAARPFTKWVGGKTRSIKHIVRLFPGSVDTYYEPFVGGGAVFFAFHDRIRKAYLSDVNEDLINAFNVVKSDVEPLLSLLKEYNDAYVAMDGRTYDDGDSYFKRMVKREPGDAIEAAARCLFLVATCFNGVYRKSKDGKLNINEGRQSNGRPVIYKPDALRAASKALRRATIESADFQSIEPARGSFVYCDPPYIEKFNAYTDGGFPHSEQVRLEASARRWRDAGAMVLLSNSDTAATRELYSRWQFEETLIHQYVSGQRSGRKQAGELLIHGGPLI